LYYVLLYVTTQIVKVCKTLFVLQQSIIVCNAYEHTANLKYYTTILHTWVKFDTWKMILWYKKFQMPYSLKMDVETMCCDNET